MSTPNFDTDNQSLVVRPIRADEAEAFLAVMCRSFGMDLVAARRIFYADPFFDLGMKRALFDEQGSIVSCLTLIPSAMALEKGVQAPICGIAGVCTEGRLRHRGYAATLISSVMRQLEQEGVYAAAALTASRPDYYEKLGWAACGRSVELTWSAAALATQQVGWMDVRVLSRDEMPLMSSQIRGLHSSSIEHRPGSFLRDERRWRCIELGSAARRVCAVWSRDAMTAYAAFSSHTDAADSGRFKIQVHELIAPDLQQEIALLAHIAALPGCAELTGEFRPSQARALMQADAGDAARACAGSPVLLRALSLPRLAGLVCAAAGHIRSGFVRGSRVIIECMEDRYCSKDEVVLELKPGRVHARPVAAKRRAEQSPRNSYTRSSVTRLMFGADPYSSSFNPLGQSLVSVYAQLFTPREIFLSMPDLF